ncbi:hypothetical protein LG634_32900 [Streptomyces bambusae]|uniref:hypothetical protein n=1 Tax=Streptomyces bambusae TaxID=1550616 RepID=UPI001CFFF47C|nr:hypothetical protein [Streptomyces bambusae]MCB5169593.1 hypothetical protein [Streptomyces bambusae]
MTDLTRSTGGSSAVEQGEVAEVAELGNTLSQLFNTLGVSQRGYAARVQQHYSVVSRFLGGRRVASRDFVERLILEVEAKLGAPLQEAAKARVRDQRLAAVRATDPAEYELEVARQEVAHARRTIARLGREQQALHDRMDRLESELADSYAERQRLGSDWAKDQVAARRRELELLAAATGHRTGREALEAELARLRADLADVTALKTDSEDRCRGLEERVLALEEELGALRAMGERGTEEAPEPPLPVAELLNALSRHLVAGELREVTRALDAAAWERPAEELIRILLWLINMESRHRAEWLVSLVCEYRSLDTVADLGRWLPSLRREDTLDPVLLAEVVRARTPQDIAVLHTAWRTASAGGRGDALLAEAVRYSPSAQLAALLEFVCDAPATEQAVHEAGRRDFRPRRLFGLSRRLAERGHGSLADAVLAVVVVLAARLPGGADEFRNAFLGLRLNHGRDLADRLLTAGAPQSVLHLLHVLHCGKSDAFVPRELVERAAVVGVLPELLAALPGTTFHEEPGNDCRLPSLLRRYANEPPATDA